MIDNQKKSISALMTTARTFRVTVIAALFCGYGLFLAYAWTALPARS